MSMTPEERQAAIDRIEEARARPLPSYEPPSIDLLARLRAEREPPVRKTAPDVIYKDGPGRVKGKNSMDAHTISRRIDDPTEPQCGEEWNTWAQAHVQRGIEAYERVVTESVGEALAGERQLHRRERDEALAPLQRELAELRGQVATLLTLFATKADVVHLPARKTGV
jgi:hypothetical protein